MMIVSERDASARGGAGETPGAAVNVMHGAFQSMLRDLEEDYWRGRPHGMAPASVRPPDTVEDAGGVRLPAVAAAEAVATQASLAEVQIRGLGSSTMAALQLREAARQMLDGPALEGRSLIGAGAPWEPYPAGDEARGEGKDAQTNAADRILRRTLTGQVPEQAYQLARLHVYRIEDGIGIRYRDARLTDHDAALLAHRLGDALGTGAPIQEIYINARGVELRGK